MAMMTHIQIELEGLWQGWDQALSTEDQAAKEKAKTAMVLLLNRRSYVRNLVRDVAQALDV